MSFMAKSSSVFLGVARHSLIIIEEHFFYLKLSTSPPQPVVFFAQARQLGGQTKSASQDQVCQGKHHVEFCGLLSQSSVASLAKPELLFYLSKNMFHFGAYGRYLVLSTFDLSLRSVGVISACTRSAIEFIPDSLSRHIPLE